MTEKPRRCGVCGLKTVVSANVEYHFEQTLDGITCEKDISELPVLRCSNCGEVSLFSESNRILDQVILDVAGLLQPDQVRSIRLGLGLSVQEMADRLRIGEDILERIEEGHQLQSRAEDTLFRLIQKLPEVRRELFPAKVRSDSGPPVTMANRTGDMPIPAE